jgi:type IV pilus assembly protein PilN
MLVDINLLPKKPPKNVALPLAISVLLLLFGAVGTFGYLQVGENKEQRLQTEEQLKKVKEQQAELQADATLIEQQQQYESLLQSVEWSQSRSIDVVFLLRHFIQLLPERGFFLNFQYTQSEKIGLQVQFDTSRQAAYYLKDLLDSPYVEKAKILSLQAVKANEEMNVNQHDETARTENEERENERLPRYVAAYEVSLRKDELPPVKKEETP